MQMIAHNRYYVVSTHSHPKVAAKTELSEAIKNKVSTHSHPKVAANTQNCDLNHKFSFNTQPPEGGC